MTVMIQFTSRVSAVSKDLFLNNINSNIYFTSARSAYVFVLFMFANLDFYNCCTAAASFLMPVS